MSKKPFKEMWKEAVGQSHRLARYRRVRQTLRDLKLRDVPETEKILKFPLNYVAYTWNEAEGMDVKKYFELFPAERKPDRTFDRLQRLFGSLKTDDIDKIE